MANSWPNTNGSQFFISTKKNREEDFDKKYSDILKKSDCLSVISYREFANVRFMTEAKILKEPVNLENKSDKITTFPILC